MESQDSACLLLAAVQTLTAVRPPVQLDPAFWEWTTTVSQKQRKAEKTEFRKAQKLSQSGFSKITAEDFDSLCTLILSTNQIQAIISTLQESNF